MKSIDPDRVKKAVYNRIDFELPDHIWEEIDEAFRQYWNNVIGTFGEIDTYGTVSYIATYLKRHHILFRFENIITIVDIIWDYLEMTGGFLSEDTLFIPPIKTEKQEKAPPPKHTTSAPTIHLRPYPQKCPKNSPTSLGSNTAGNTTPNTAP